eukprot:TRINITY_DN11285_c0_g1_i1.p1 TRINITY_DN11285_c0_g1~~TRINITY_DN11285_c0_g1_i1.p1  ORF type:complete len:804 (+),score=94.16 TRINITY_DN11285_c0_g1_i1:58-2469(+)
MIQRSKRRSIFPRCKFIAMSFPGSCSLFIVLALIHVYTDGAEDTAELCPAEVKDSSCGNSLVVRKTWTTRVSESLVEDAEGTWSPPVKQNFDSQKENLMMLPASVLGDMAQSLVGEGNISKQSLGQLNRSEEFLAITVEAAAGGLEMAHQAREVQFAMQQADEAKAAYNLKYMEQVRAEMAEAERVAGGQAEFATDGCSPQEEIVDPSAAFPEIPSQSHHKMTFRCSQSCASGSTTPCPLLIVLHGTGMNAADMFWLMMRNKHKEGHDEATHGPLCTAWLKSSGIAWDYDPDGFDSKLVEAAIRHIENTRALDQDRIYLHGFSSGAIMSYALSCGRLGERIAAIVPYAGGLMSNLQCAWRQHILAVHGTRDCVVPYDEGLTEAPSAGGSYGLACGEMPNADRMIPLRPKAEWPTWGQTPTYAGTGARAALHAAIANGYSTLAPVLPAKVRSFDLAATDDRNWNIAADETDEFVYPAGEGACGSSTLWRINSWGHAYPNQVNSKGVTQFWEELWNWLATRVRCRPRTKTVCSNTNLGSACASPKWNKATIGNPPQLIKHIMMTSQDGITADACRLQCQRSKGCSEGWFVEEYKLCVLYGLPWGAANCKSRRDWGKTITTFECEQQPLGPTPATPRPTPAPPSPAAQNFCIGDTILQKADQAGYSCTAGGDSNIGGTEVQCMSKGGAWRAYTCESADDYWKSQGGDAWQYASFFRGPWSTKCCKAASGGLCVDGKALQAEAEAGNRCTAGGDSNVGGSQAKCSAKGGQWNPYTCGAAERHWVAEGGVNWQFSRYFSGPWRSKCCA